ncbi:MAG: hypothetical protein LC800_15335 [Acidobacteria bacterium]|nr:hypothetical protein [Acidobacteriota bacterium]
MGSSPTETRRRGEHQSTHAPPRSSAGETDSQTSRAAEPAPLSDEDETSESAEARKGAAPPSSDALTERGGERLTRALIAKSLAEALFLVALVALFSYSYFNPHFRGALDGANETEVVGWAVDESAPDTQVEVQLFIDGHFVAARRADRPRPDVLAAGRAARAEHGFSFETPPLPAREAEYEARVYALHATRDAQRRTLRQIGDALRFKVAAGERNRDAPGNWWEVPRGR